MLELLKLLISKDFVSNAKDIIALIKRSKAWKKDIVKYNGAFYYKDKIDSTILIEETVKVASTKSWSAEEQQELKFILSELFENSFEYGTPSKENSVVNADIIITSTFVKLTISDFGLDFDLKQELINQEAFNPTSGKHKGLSLIAKMTPDLKQEKSPTRNILIVTKRQGLKPLRIRKDGDILIFEVSNSTYIDDGNFNTFVDRINELTSDSKIIIDFSGTAHAIGSRAIRDVSDTLTDAKQRAQLRIAVCGLSKAPFAIREYFSNRFQIFETFDEAVNFHLAIDSWE